MNIIRYGLVLLLSYLIGCSSMALYISKYKKFLYHKYILFKIIKRKN